MVNVLLFGAACTWLVQICSATLFPFSNDSLRDVFLPNKWNTIADCPVRYYDLGFSSYVAPAFGTPAFEKEFAHMAAIGWTDTDGTITWNCGGSLIAENFVLTAAHCGFWQGKSPDVVRMGDLNLARDDDNKHAQQLKIVDHIYHPEYTAKYRYHDLLLLRLNQSVTVHPTVCPACLWVNSTVRFKSVEACGYGQTGYFDEKTPQLLKVTLSPVSSNNCSQYYPPDRKLNKGLTDQQICAVDPEFKQDTCPGDSGGPLQIKLLGYGRINPFLIGVTSFGKSCGTETPGVYVRVSSYIDWIEQVTGQDVDPLRCAYKYSEHRDYEPDIIIDKSEDGSFEYVDATKLHFDTDVKSFEHRATIEPSGCSGIFIHEEYVLTSATCLLRAYPKPEVVISTGEVVHTYKILRIINHPSFRPGSLDVDLALIQLAEKVVFQGGVVIPGCLWSMNSMPTEQLEVTGTGPNGAQALYPEFEKDKLLIEPDYLAARSSEIPLSKCQKFYNDEEGLKITDSSVCYGNTSWYILPDSCALDLGGPLGRKYYGAGSKFFNYVMGINSYGNDCGFGFPAVATKVNDYIPWIDSIIFAEPLGRGDACESPVGSGKCTLASECKAVVERVKGGNSLNPFVCDFSDHLNPLVCCPRTKTSLDECPSLYRKFRKPAQEGVRVRELNQAWAHLVVLNEESSCYGSLISDQVVIASSRCANSRSKLPMKLRIGDPKCNPVEAEALSVEEMTTAISILKLKEPLTLSACVLPICLWTDDNKIPFEISALPLTEHSLVATSREKCEAAIGPNEGENFGCALIEYYYENCELSTPEPLQTIRNESNIVIPYLVGMGGTRINCNSETGTKLLYFEKVSSIVDKVLTFLG